MRRGLTTDYKCMCTRITILLDMGMLSGLYQGAKNRMCITLQWIMSYIVCSLTSIHTTSALLQRYFYNSTSGSCEQFAYGGCDGNENNFEDIENCQNTCESKSTLLEVYIYMCMYLGWYYWQVSNFRFVLANCFHISRRKISSCPFHFEWLQYRCRRYAVDVYIMKLMRAKFINPQICTCHNISISCPTKFEDRTHYSLAHEGQGHGLMTHVVQIIELTYVILSRVTDNRKQASDTLQYVSLHLFMASTALNLIYLLSYLGVQYTYNRSIK